MRGHGGKIGIEGQRKFTVLDPVPKIWNRCWSADAVRGSRREEKILLSRSRNDNGRILSSSIVPSRSTQGISLPFASTNGAGIPRVVGIAAAIMRISKTTYRRRRSCPLHQGHLGPGLQAMAVPSPVIVGSLFREPASSVEKTHIPWGAPVEIMVAFARKI